jgi:hypothetical protein
LKGSLNFFFLDKELADMEQKASGPTAELARRDNEREEKERRKSTKRKTHAQRESNRGTGVVVFVLSFWAAGLYKVINFSLCTHTQLDFHMNIPNLPAFMF